MNTNIDLEQTGMTRVKTETAICPKHMPHEIKFKGGPFETTVIRVFFKDEHHDHAKRLTTKLIDADSSIEITVHKCKRGLPYATTDPVHVIDRFDAVMQTSLYLMLSVEQYQEDSLMLNMELWVMKKLRQYTMTN
jgi:hypothetical protein